MLLYYLACVTASARFSTALATLTCCGLRSPYETNFWTASSAIPVNGPVTTSERITSRNGDRNAFGSDRKSGKEHWDHTRTPNNGHNDVSKGTHNVTK